MSSNPSSKAQAMLDRVSGLAGLEQLLEIMVCLRDSDGGCPWDLEQDFASIVPFTIEEAYEVADAIARNDLKDLKDELGDLLLQVVYHAQMAQEQNAFDFNDVAEAIATKMLRRHPHVFGDAVAQDGVAVKKRWEDIKAQERKESKGSKTSELDDVGTALPAIMRADKIIKRARRVGFDWPDVALVKAKIDEEFEELAEAQASGDQAAIEDEFGDVMFTLVALGQHLKLNSEEALRQANAKFERRFRAIEQELGDLSQHSLSEMEAAWQRVKRRQAKILRQ